MPYAEFSLAYSRGATAASYLWLSAWSQAKGDFTGYRFSTKKPVTRPGAARYNPAFGLCSHGKDS